MKKQLLFLATALLVLSGCDKENEILYPDPLFPAQEIFNAPLFIEVFAANGLRVSNAKINLGAVEGHTDASGLCYFADAPVAASTYLTVEKEGYFHASRRFYPGPGKAQYIKIILLSDSRIAFFNAADGAVLPLDDWATISFPDHGYLLENGKAYDGIVVVSAKIISADDQDLSLKMPGDLVGINSDGDFGALGSLGMIAVEINTPDGDKLRFANGVEATLEMVIPQDMMDKSPSAIPLWHFDESEGIWKEEGMAIKSGDRYVGQVTHFSFWNCDAWFETVSWGASFSYEDGSPASQVKVCVTIDNLGATKCDYTAIDGRVKGMVASKEVLTVEVYGKCGQKILDSQVGPYSNDSFYGPVTVSDPSAQSNVSGYAVDCELKPLVNGFVKISTGQNSYFVVPEAGSGAFEIKVSGCVEGLVNVYAFNPDESTFSKTISAPFSPEVMVDTLYTCTHLNEHAVIQIEGFANPIYFDSLELRISDGYTSIRALDISNNTLGIWFRGSSIGSFNSSDGPLIRGFIDLVQYRSVDPLIITVEEYGEIGELVSGKINGKVQTSVFNFVPEYVMTGSFSVRRE